MLSCPANARKAGMARRSCYGADMVCKPALNSALGLALTFTLSACASTSDRYPSLAIRDAERIHAEAEAAEPAPPPPPAPPSAALVQRLSQLRAEANRAHQAFLGAAPRTRSLVNAARGSAAGSDPWISAQVSLSQLEMTRRQAMSAMADLDKLLLQTEQEGGPTDVVAATQGQVGAMLDEENALMRQLAGSLRR